MPPISGPAAPDASRRASCGGCGIRAIGCGRIASRRSTAIDLSSAVLDVLAWGGDPRTLEWFERPRDEALDAAMTLLERLGLIRVRNRNRQAAMTPRA